MQLITEPGHKGIATDGVEPERDFGQLDRYRVQVDAEHVVIGDIHLHPLQLAGVAILRNAFALGLLLVVQIGFGQLVDGFVQEGRTAHRRLADGQMQDSIGPGMKVINRLDLLLEQLF